MKRTAPVLAACLLAACATSRLDTSAVTSRVTPSQVVEAFPEHRGAGVQWGGRIVSIINKDQSTHLEVLSYPVARDGFPNDYRDSTGRFVIRHDGFLEPQDYAPGRRLTVVGTVASLIQTSIGDAGFVVPQLEAQQLKLWPEGYGDGGRSRFGFGVGISIGL